MSDEEKIQALRDAQDNWYIDNWSSFGEDQEELYYQEEDYYEERY